MALRKQSLAAFPRSASAPNIACRNQPSSANSFDLLPIPSNSQHHAVNKKKRKRKAKANAKGTSIPSSPESVGLGLGSLTTLNAHTSSAADPPPLATDPQPLPEIKLENAAEQPLASSPLRSGGNISFSFSDYLRDELTATDFDSVQELKRERITNFLAVPSAIEKLMAFGFVVCLDSFLYTFTILPLRFGLALYQCCRVVYTRLSAMMHSRESTLWLRPSQKCDLLKGLLCMITCAMMWTYDPSRIYHFIRGQAVLKLYVIFSVLEIFDKLCCAAGTDILDALFSKSTLGSSPIGIGGAAYAKRQLRPITLFILASGYMVIHTSVLFLEMITLNVSINFYSNALLSLLISNQFVEIKQSVFKKFEKENLFQLSCSDIVERFQQTAFLTIITLRNVVELSESSPSSILPSTFVPLFKLPASTSLNTLMTPVVMVLASELIVDWLKHAFITKFNQIRPSIYSKYIDVLCKDLVVGSPSRLSRHHNTFIDQSPVVSRRIGFPSLPLACLMVRMVLPMLPLSPDGSGVVPLTISQSIFGFLTKTPVLPARLQLMFMSMLDCVWLQNALDKAFYVLLLIFMFAVAALCLLAVKVFVGINLLGFAYKRYASMADRDEKEKVKEEQMRDIGKHEEAYKHDLRQYLNDPADNVMGSMPVKYTMETVDRFSMVRSRIP